MKAKALSLRALAALALCAVTLLAYSNSFQAGFALDNKRLLLLDPRLKEASAQNGALILQHSYWWPYGESGLYRPVTTLSYLLNYSVLGNGERPAGYHWINIILHLGNVLLVCAIALRVIGQFWPSVFIAGLWALHPVLTEAVTNIVGRADLLAAMSVLGGLLLYLKSAEAAGRWARFGWLAGLSAVTAVGVFSKESAVSILAVVLIFELTRWGRSKQAQALLLGCLAITWPILAMWYQRSAVLGSSAPAEFAFCDNPLTGADFWTARLTAIKAMARYLWLTVWPAKLSCDYSYSQIGLARGSLQDWLAWILIAAAVAGVALLFRRNRAAFFFACFACVTFVPVSNLLFPVGTIMAERFLYLPSVGLIACMVLAMYEIGRRFRLPLLVPVALYAIAVAYGARTWARNPDWRDDLTMASAAVRTSPNSFKTHYLLAQALYESDSRHSNLDRVIAEAETSVAILDTLPDARNTAAPYRWAAECHLLKGDARGSTQDYQRSLELLLKTVSILKATRLAADAGLYRALSTAYLRLGSRDEAAVQLMQGIFLTADSGLWQELLSLYRNGLDAKGCATRLGPRGPALNPSCDVVRRHFCAAAAGTIRAALQTARQDLASNTKRAAVEQFGCAAGPLHEILPDGQ